MRTTKSESRNDLSNTIPFYQQNKIGENSAYQK